MEKHATSGYPSAEANVWVWFILAGLLVSGALVGVGALALIHASAPTDPAVAQQPAPPPR